MSESDGELIARVSASDHEAFRFLFAKYQPILFRHVLYSLRDADAAHDIVQETFLRVWQHRESLDPRLSFLGYTLRISSNLLRDRAKHYAVRRKRELDVQQAGYSTVENPESLLHARMFEERIADVAQKLPTKCREVFLLSRMEGMSNAEISTHLRISVKTVENQITRALKVLRRNLAEFTKSRE